MTGDPCWRGRGGDEWVGKRQPCNKTELTPDRLVCSDSLNWLQLGVEHNLSFAEHCYWNWWISCSLFFTSICVLFQVKKAHLLIAKTLLWKLNALTKSSPALVVVFAFYSHLYCLLDTSTKDICCYFFLYSVNHNLFLFNIITKQGINIETTNIQQKNHFDWN